MSDNKYGSRPIGICQRTGFKVPASELVQEWTGLWVCRDWYDPKHPVLDYEGPRGESIRESATGPDLNNDIGDTNPPPSLDELGANN